AQKTALNELKREYVAQSCLPSELVQRQTQANMRCEQLWRELRPKNDWKGFEASLQEVIQLAREEAQLRADVQKLSPYDALMEKYDPGNRSAWVRPLFQDLKIFLKDFLPKALAAQDER